MICKPCRNAGNELSSDCPDLFAVADQHARCKGGTWCACQHKTEPVVRKQDA